MFDGRRLSPGCYLRGGAYATYYGAQLLGGDSDKEHQSGGALLVGAFWLNISAPFIYYDAVVKMRTRLTPYNVAKAAAEEYNRAILIEIEKQF